uniref:Uncharacterized protein n=1 Tax=Anopheles atroparvus TaxID=41427 RepID=A0A182J4E3_ANOAO
MGTSGLEVLLLRSSTIPETLLYRKRIRSGKSPSKAKQQGHRAAERKTITRLFRFTGFFFCLTFVSLVPRILSASSFRLIGCHDLTGLGPFTSFFDTSSARGRLVVRAYETQQDFVRSVRLHYRFVSYRIVPVVPNLRSKRKG